jgi:FkbH-like protein
MTRQIFLNAFRGVLEADPAIVVIHSSLADLVPSSNVDRWDLLYGLDRLIEEGWTVALPAFTFSFCKGHQFHLLNSPSEVGVLADWMLTSQPDSLRTCHPIYSFVVAGPAAQHIRDCLSETTFGDDSPFGLFEHQNATLVMLGCGWKHATQFHRYEEKAKVSYRYFKEFTGPADFCDGIGVQDVSASMYVRQLSVAPVNDFSPAIARLRSEGLIKSKSLFRGHVESVRVADLARVSAQTLNDDPMAFVTEGRAVSYRQANLQQAETTPRLQVAVLGNSNVHLLNSALQQELSTLMPERRVEIYEVPYGQLLQSVIDPNSALRRFHPHVSIFCDRIEDLLHLDLLNPPSAEVVSESVEQYAALIATYHAANGGWIIIQRFGLNCRSIDEGGDRKAAAMIDQMNAFLKNKLGGLKQILWLDVATEAASSGVRIFDFRLWHLGRMPYSEPFSRRLARRWAGMILASLGKTVRAVVLDLDNTLWGGVLGEDGIAGLQVGGDFPGNAFLAFQRLLKALTKRGIALAICSKNDGDLALKALDNLHGMQLRSTDIAAYRINWQPKSANIREIATELNLGVESLLFIDDNPVEREEVRRNLPGVKVLDLPPDPAGYVDSLITSPWLEVGEITVEDRRRTESYKFRSQVEHERQTASSLEVFWAALKMTLHFQSLSEENIARAAQLCVKTNQFNTTTNRYDQRDLKQIVDEGGDVVILGLEDRYSELENIGLIILRPDHENLNKGTVDSYLLSCRVLGRGLEKAVLHWALYRASTRNWTTLQGTVIETERNNPARAIFREAGFSPGINNGEWQSQSSGDYLPPPWLSVIDHLGYNSAAHGGAKR